MPSLKQYYVDQQLSFKETFNAYIKSLGADPEDIWDAIKDTIAEVRKTSYNFFSAKFMNLIMTSFVC